MSLTGEPDPVSLNWRRGQAVVDVGSNALKATDRCQSIWGLRQRPSGSHLDADSFIRHKELPALVQGAQFGADSQSWQSARSLRDCSGLSSRAWNVRATLESSECLRRARADVSRSRGARMHRGRLAQPRGFGGLLEQPAELTRGQRLMFDCGLETVSVVLARRRQHPRSVAPSTIAAIASRPLPAASRVDPCGLRLHDADYHLLPIDVTRSQPLSTRGS